VSARTTTCSLLAIAATLLLPGCDQQPDPRKDPRLIEIDGITITFEDLKPYYDWLTAYRPEAGERTKYTWALREHVLPLKLAQREFPKERAEQKKAAESLRSVVTYIQDLEKQSELITNKTRSNLTRQSALLPVAMFLFDDLTINSVDLTLNTVSDPIELPHGFFLVSAYERHESQLVMADYVDALQVGFITHTANQWQEYWTQKRQEIGKKVTFLHPDYRDDMPPWIQVPQPEKP